MLPFCLLLAAETVPAAAAAAVLLLSFMGRQTTEARQSEPQRN